jgi:hypothetical protein
MLYPSRSRHEIQWFYATRLELGHPRDAITFYYHLSKKLFSNNVYSNGDGQVTNSIKPADDVMTVATQALLIKLYVNSP